MNNVIDLEPDFEVILEANTIAANYLVASTPA